MTKIEDCLEPLNNGVWEVVFPKEEITEPLSDEWIQSPLNVPTPGTIASYRNGQYHVHETKTEWRVHLDRYDPKLHPMLHLIDDAPLILMISETILMLFSEARGRSTNTRDNIIEQERSVKRGYMFGIILFLIGCTFIITPEIIYNSLFGIVIPIIAIVIGIVTMARGITRHPVQISNQKDVINGGLIVLIGVILGMLPMIFWSLILIFILGFWMLLSAVMLLNRVRKGKSAVPEGFYSRLVIAVVSLIFFVTLIYAPDVILEIFMLIIGLILILIGCTLITATVQLRDRSAQHSTEKIP